MTTRRKLRDELHDLTPDLDLGASSADLMRRGRRIRATKQGAVVGAVALVVTGIGTTAAQLGHHGGRTSSISSATAGNYAPNLPIPASPAPSSPAPSSPAHSPFAVPVSSSPGPAASAAPASGSATPVGSPTPVASPPPNGCAVWPMSTEGAPPASDGKDAVPWGSQIKVGSDVGGTTPVIYAFHIDNPQLPCVNVGFMLGTETSGAVSAMTAEVAANEVEGTDIAAGFHATSESGGNDQLSNWYIFGYYVGPPATISIPEKQSAAASTQATVVPWSVDPDVQVWWISGTGAVPNVGVPSARDAQGNLLPAGNASTPGVG
jgi:hypothetical protein